MLRFGTYKKLGAVGVMYLIYHVANTFGIDKCSRKDQWSWVTANAEQISLVANDPFGAGHAFLVDAAKAGETPWQFLAACIEIDEAWNYDDGAVNFWSALPVYVDGSCNGLQHLSAMIRDKIGADATNLTGTPVREDIYGIIADKVIKHVEGDYDGDWAEAAALATNWQGHVTRNTVKRGVMTTPYGVTDIGLRDQLIQDKHCAKLDGDLGSNATYMRNVMRDCIKDTVVAASVVMKWMQDNAAAIATDKRPLTWTTPIGFIVRQAYYVPQKRRVSTVSGVGQYASISLSYEDPTQGLRVRKQRDAIAPNVIHSFDSAHMMLSVLAAHDSANIRHFSVIHDSFGCHAADMEAFHVCIREQFAVIYRQDWIQSLQLDFQASAPDAKLTTTAVFTGDAKHDIEGVLKDAYFFA